MGNGGSGCCKKRQAVEGDEDARLNSSEPAGSRGTATVTLRNLAGESIVLEDVSVDSPLHEVRDFVKKSWGMPLLAQRFVLRGKIVEAPDAQAIGRAFEVENGGEVEVSCLRTALPHQEQRRVDEELMLAAARGDCVAISELIADGARPAGPTKRRQEGEPPLDDEEAPAFDEPSDAEGGRTPSPLLLARAAGHDEAVQLLRGYGAPEPSIAPEQWSLGRAFSKGDLAEVARLLAHNADPNTRLHRGQGIRDTSSGCPLHACCAQHERPGIAAVAELLLRLGADHSFADNEGDTPLAHAHYFGAGNVRAVLEAHSAKVAGPYYSTWFSAHRRLFGVNR